MEITKTKSETTTVQSFVEQNKLTETNYVHWLDNLRLLLKKQGKLYVLDGPLPNTPLDINATNNTAVEGAYEKHVQDNYDVGSMMLAAMSSHIQKMMVRVESVDAYQINVTLKKMFQHLVRQERFVTASAFFSCKMAEGASVSSHILKMKGYVNRLDRLGYPLDQELATDVILNSLSKDYGQFVTSYVNGSMDKSISELQLMLTAVEMSIVNVVAVPKHDAAPPMVVGAVVGGKVTKKAPGNKGNTQNAKKKPYEDAICHHCNETGHWKRNCKLYLEYLNFKKAFCSHDQAHTTA